MPSYTSWDLMPWLAAELDWRREQLRQCGQGGRPRRPSRARKHAATMLFRLAERLA